MELVLTMNNGQTTQLLSVKQRVNSVMFEKSNNSFSEFFKPKNIFLC